MYIFNGIFINNFYLLHMKSTQMISIAAQIAQNRHLTSSDYRDVMHELKKEQSRPRVFGSRITSRDGQP